jgi:hypothetical protein
VTELAQMPPLFLAAMRWPKTPKRRPGGDASEEEYPSTIKTMYKCQECIKPDNDQESISESNFYRKGVGKKKGRRGSGERSLIHGLEEFVSELLQGRVKQPNSKIGGPQARVRVQEDLQRALPFQYLHCPEESAAFSRTFLPSCKLQF